MIVVSCSVLVKMEDKILFIKESKEVTAGKYGLPGGKLEPGETLQQCAERECLEETGLTVKAQELIAVSQKPKSRELNNVIRYIFIGKLNDNLLIADGELELFWLSESEFRGLALNGKIRGADVVDVVKKVFRGEVEFMKSPDLY
jgi:ADP-ribose pyrophosphatase YjhB (NUDIX family)